MENESGFRSANVVAAERFVQNLLQSKLGSEYHYHNLTHTKDVVEASLELSHQAGLNHTEKEILLIAAWFHDTGYTQTSTNHERHSAEIAEEWLSKTELNKQARNQIIEVILSTKKDAPKTTQLAEILHDADHAHLGRKRFFQRGEMLRTELEALNDQKYTNVEWERIQYQFLLNSEYLTIEAQNLYGERRARNIVKQREALAREKKAATRKKTGKDIGRGIDTLYRTNYRNHINFSSIADGKANMMISINTILISVIVTLSGASLSLDTFTIERFRFVVPIIIMLVGASISVVFAVLSARPKVTTRKISQEDIDNDKVSLLYFGNFQGVPKEMFVNYLNDLKLDQQRLYDTMSEDLYNLGSVLKEKYRLLTISYNTFMIGLSLSVVAFIVIFIYTNS